ncbi:MAG TPA: PAS domain-containing sensor histidine kinase [Candidatus Brocadiia bacterium]|nr:PAS domain S-box protein [Candidatus Brocadiales bacterium]
MNFDDIKKTELCSQIQYRLIEELRESVTKFRVIFDSAQDAIVIINDKGKISQWNRAAERIFGFASEDVIGKKLHTLIIPRKYYREFEKEFNQFKITAQANVTNHPVEFMALNKVGAEFPIEVSISSTQIKDGWYSIWIIRDISGRKQAEERLKESEQKFKTIFDNAMDGLLLADCQNKMFYMGNKKICQMLGYSEEEIKAIGVMDIHPERYLPYVIEQFEKQTKKEFTLAKDIPVKRKDGSVFYADINSFPVTLDGKMYLLGVFRDVSERRQLEEMLIMLNESLEQRVAERTSDLKKANIQLEQAYKELKSKQRQLIQAEKMATLGQLAASIAHEINNPLSFVYNNCDTLNKYSERLGKFLKKFEDGKPIFERGKPAQMMSFFQEVRDLRKEIKLDVLLDDFVEIIKEATIGVKRIKSIVDNLLFSSRIEGATPVYANLNNIIDDILVLVLGEIKYKAAILKKYGDIPEIKCYPQQLGQVFMNLLVNAAHAIKGRGKIYIKTYQAENNVCVEIKDTGKGIPKDLHEKIFEPFFTTKEPGKGTGLGLTVAYDIIQKHAGSIKVSSKVGKGSTFTVVLPMRGVRPNKVKF